MLVRPRTTVQRRRWRVAATSISKAERDAVIDFFDARDGAEGSFLWTPPGAAAQVAVAFVTGSLRDALVWVDTYDVSFELVELLN